MSITGVLRSGFMQLRVLDMEKAVTHYVKHVGLNEVGRDPATKSVFLKGWDEFDHHTLTLRETDTAGMDFIGFKVQNDAYIDVLEQKTNEFGLNCYQVPANSDQPGFGRRLAVDLPTGHRLDFFAETEMAAEHPGIRNPDIWPKEPHGMGVSAFDHALLYGPNSAEAVRYCTQVMGMGVVEVIKMPDGNGDICTWLTSANRTHDLAILEYDKPDKLHHVGFRLEDWSEVGRAADLISINDIALDAGPMRHGVTRGKTIYFFDPSGNRNEVYSSGYPYYPDMPTRVWDFDHVGKGVFYYTRELNDTFLSVVS